MSQRLRAHLAICTVAIAVSACKFPYPADVPDDDVDEDATTACEPTTTTCADATLVVCDAAGQPASVTPCTFGCAPAGDRCGDLAPSNGLGMYLDQARAAAPIVLTGDALVDTDNGRVTVNGNVVAVQTAIVSSAPVDILVVIAGTFEANNVTARGRRALAIVSDGDVLLHGTLSVSASREVPGAGASATNDPACTARRGTAGTVGTGGAGGGGFGNPGGRGGDGADGPGGDRGAPVGDETLVPLRGGCPGAHLFAVPSVEPMQRQPGAGGGALQLATRTSIRLDQSATISASGGGAKGNTEGPISPVCSEQGAYSCDAGSGGGAGGAILLEAAVVSAPASAAIVANGGAGHCGFVGYAPDGRRAESVADGSNCSTLNGAGSGGSGGAGAVSGATGASGARTGGGGGGGSGRIRISLPLGVPFDAGPPIVSPTPSLGVTVSR